MILANMSSKPIEGEDSDLNHLSRGGLLGFPTETVWGLAGNSKDASAMSRLIQLKGRPSGQPISVLVSGRKSLESLGVQVTPILKVLLSSFWPGPLTVVTKAEERFAEDIGREDGAIGFRCSSHPIAYRLTREAELRGLGPLTATSCNRSGEPPALTRAEARIVCERAPQGCMARLVNSLLPDASGEQPSTVLDVTSSAVRILREGAIKKEAIFDTIEASRTP